VNLAARKRVGLPRTVDVRTQFCAQSLNGAPRDHFDRCYAKAQCLAHEEAVAAFEAEAERGQDPDLKAFAARALPKLKEHLHMIKAIVMKFEKESGHESSKETSK
jgi:putative membrane protein